MKVEDFIEASAYIRVLEKRMLSGNSVNRMIEASNTVEALRQIAQNSEYDFSSLKRPEDYEQVLVERLQETYRLLYQLSPHKVLIDIPASKYTFHNLKVALKSKRLKKDFSYLYSKITDLDVTNMEAFVLHNEKKDDLPEHIVDAIQSAENSYLESKDPQVIDILLDKHMFSHTLSLCDKVRNDFITDYVRLNIDFTNVKTLMRVKNMRKGTRFLNESLIPGGLTDTEYFLSHYDKTPDTIASIFYYKYFGDIMNKGIEQYNKTGTYASMEKLFDDYLIEYTKKAKYVAFGPEVLFAYLLSKENEIRQIRILITCKNNGIQVETLKERLRDNYV